MRRPPRQLNCERKPPPKLETEDHNVVGMSIAKKIQKKLHVYETAQISELVRSVFEGPKHEHLVFHAIDTAPKTRLRNSQ